MTIQEKRIRAELASVVSARFGMDLRIAEMQETIERINRDIVIQETKEKELEQKLLEIQGG